MCNVFISTSRVYNSFCQVVAIEGQHKFARPLLLLTNKTDSSMSTSLAAFSFSL